MPYELDRTCNRGDGEDPSSRELPKFASDLIARGLFETCTVVAPDRAIELEYVVGATSLAFKGGMGRESRKVVVKSSNASERL